MPGSCSLAVNETLHQSLWSHGTGVRIKNPVTKTTDTLKGQPMIGKRAGLEYFSFHEIWKRITT